MYRTHPYKVEGISVFHVETNYFVSDIQMSKRSRDDDIEMGTEPLGPRVAKRKVLELQAAERAKKEAASQKREVGKKLRADVDDLSGLFGKISAHTTGELQPIHDTDMEGMGRRRRRRHTRKHKKSKKSKKTRKH